MVKILSGDIGFVMTHHSFIARAIAWFMGSKWSHTFLVAGEFQDRTLTVETSDFETFMAPLDRYLVRGKTIEIWRCISPQPMKQIVDEAIGQVGVVYGYLQLISLGIRRLLMRIGIRIPNFIRQGAVCTSIPLIGYSKYSAVEGLKGIDPEGIDTEELYQIISRSPDFELVHTKSMNNIIWE